jgi:pyruvate-formate lyase-activating enzyme
MTGIFHLILIKPTHYDDAGYPLQWRYSTIPSNALACVNGLAEDCRARRVLGAETDLRITAMDETNAVVDPARLIRRIRADGGKALVGLVGVQSNQFPRAMDLARPFRAAGLPVCVGGFHASGVLAMLGEPPPELREATAAGISFFIGEAEQGRLDEALRDAAGGTLKPYYDWRDKLPDLQGAPIPFLGRDEVNRTYGSYSSFDLGRGCPFQCSFCTIINVQGRVSRFRSADDLERIVRANAKIGINRFFLTDDNLARNRNWEPCFDRLIELREKEGLKVRLQVQVDTLCHRIPGFIDKAVRAGVDQVFVGLENINPDNLAAAKKAQNRITEYRELFLAWKKHPVVVTAGYIIGFPHDTRESILRDIDLIKRELPVDLIYFTNLTPLPGSEDHLTLTRAGVWMDPDLNKYDLNHRVTHHGRMSDAEWDAAYNEVWERFYTFEHMATILRRMTALGSNMRYTTVYRLLWYRGFRKYYGCHPLEGGFFRIRRRKDRRPGLPVANPLAFYAWHWGTELRAVAAMCRDYLRLRRIMLDIWTGPSRYDYRDAAISPAGPAHQDTLLAEVRGGSDLLARQARQKELIAEARANVAAE